MPTKYIVIDLHTNTQVGKPYSDRKRASNRCNKLDLEYGAIRYAVRRVEDDSISIHECYTTESREAFQAEWLAVTGEELKA